MREKQFEKIVRQYLEDHGCWVLKTWSNGVQREGVPDLLVCCNGHFLAVELKNETGKPSALQLWNIEQIRAANGIAIVLYPNQYELFKALVTQLQSRITDRRTQYEFDRKVNHDKT